MKLNKLNTEERIELSELRTKSQRFQRRINRFYRKKKRLNEQAEEEKGRGSVSKPKKVNSKSGSSLKKVVMTDADDDRGSASITKSNKNNNNEEDEDDDDDADGQDDDQDEDNDDNDQDDDDEEGENNSRPPTHSDEDEEDSEEGDEVIEALPEPIKQPPKFRKSVSAEAYGMFNKKGYFSARVISKEEATKNKIKEKLLKSFMFQALDEKDLNIVVDAMEEKRYARGDHVIDQGDDGNELFVVGEGRLHCYRTENGDNNLVKTYSPGDYFGDLALLYNVPRAATIIAIKDNVVWYSLDRLTFSHIVGGSAIQRREKYEEILKKVKILESMDNDERGKLIDSISEVKFKKGECIIKQGEKGDKFFFITEGTAIAKKVLAGQKDPVTVMNYKEGDYFGEVSLIKNQPRAASIYAESDIITLYLNRQMFNRLLGPLNDILKRNMKLYTHFDNIANE